MALVIYLHHIWTFLSYDFILLGLVCHRFPNPNRYMERLLKWIDIIGLDKSDALSINQKKVICADHFGDSCSSPGTKRLNVNAYPTLNLPGITYSR